MFQELKRIISRSGMSAERLAEQAGCHPGTIYAWLDGRTREPELNTLVKVARVFGKSVELTDGDARLVDTPASVAAKMNTAREFVGYWRRYQ